MNIPRNHHYVSRVLIKKFADDNGVLYYYDKQLNNFGISRSAKRIFSERDLNTTISENDELDYSSTEEKLHKNFETNFNHFYNKLNDALENKLSDELIEAIKYLIKLGIIGESRTPHYKKRSQEAFFSLLGSVTSYSSENVKNHFLNNKDLKYLNTIDYNEVCNGKISLMGKSYFKVLIAPAGEFILLPDCTSITLRHQLESDSYFNGELYLNQARPISTVIMPINSKLILVAQSEKICPVEYRYHGTQEISKKYVYEYNRLLFEKANRTVICGNRDYLKEFITKYRKQQTQQGL